MLLHWRVQRPPQCARGSRRVAPNPGAARTAPRITREPGPISLYFAGAREDSRSHGCSNHGPLDLTHPLIGDGHILELFLVRFCHFLCVANHPGVIHTHGDRGSWRWIGLVREIYCMGKSVGQTQRVVDFGVFSLAWLALPTYLPVG